MCLTACRFDSDQRHHIVFYAPRAFRRLSGSFVFGAIIDRNSQLAVTTLSKISELGFGVSLSRLASSAVNSRSTLLLVWSL